MKTMQSVQVGSAVCGSGKPLLWILGPCVIESHELTLEIYRMSANFPRAELYGLTSQLRRSCSSISANIAEGCGRNGAVELARFCSIASGSAAEFGLPSFTCQRPEADSAES